MLSGVPWSVVGYRGVVLHQPRAWKAVLDPEQSFTDFTGVGHRVIHFGERDLLTRPDTEQYPYPVPSIYVFLLFWRLSSHPLIAYLSCVFCLFGLVTCWLSWRLHRVAAGALPQVGVWSTLVLGFPLLVLIDRANIEAVIWALVLLGLVAFAKNRMITSALLWAAAASLKIAPGIFMMLYLARRKYSVLAFAVLAAAAFFILALAGIGPSIHQAAADSSKSASFLLSSFIVARSLPEFDESLFGAVKQVIHVYFYTIGAEKSHEIPMVMELLRLYNLVIPVAFLVLYYFKLRRLPILNQLMAYTLLYVLLPQVSYEYKLIFVYLAWAAFLLFLLTDVAAGRIAISARAMYTIMFTCAVTFAPLTYLVIYHSSHSFRFGGQVKVIFLMIMLCAILQAPMPSSMFGELSAPRDGTE